MSQPTLRPSASKTGGMTYTQLGRSGLKISKVLLGAMSFGTMEGWMLPAEEALPILKHAYDKGINTWDTSDVYSYGESEAILGQAIKKYNIPRERLVILSKCYGGIPSTQDVKGLSDTEQLMLLAVNDGIMVNRIGLSRKHIFDAVKATTERLGTYLDVLQIHRLDREAPREEIMKALNDVVDSGMARYIGASSMHAWEFQALNNIAEKNGWHKFISMQDYYSLLHREEEREMHPYCHDAGIGLIPWSPMARGLLTRPYDLDKDAENLRQQTDRHASMLIGPLTKEDLSIIGRVEELAKKKGCSMAQIATVWCLVKGVNPILGLSSTKRVDEATKAVVLYEEGLLTAEDVKYLDELYVPKNHLAHAW